MHSLTHTLYHIISQTSALMVCVLLCRYSTHILTVVIASYLIVVQADINNVHR